MATFKHLTPEEEYFAREEVAKLKKIVQEKRNKLAQEEKERLKTVHWMHCARCGNEMHPILFRGVSVDKCFNCGGVYLESGELENLAGKESGFFQSILSLFKYDPVRE
jgi:hypothetical protein